jgi:hypothetical protein
MTSIWCRRFEVPASPAASSFRNFNSIGGTGQHHAVPETPQRSGRMNQTTEVHEFIGDIAEIVRGSRDDLTGLLGARDKRNDPARMRRSVAAKLCDWNVAVLGA